MRMWVMAGLLVLALGPAQARDWDRDWENESPACPPPASADSCAAFCASTCTSQSGRTTLTCGNQTVMVVDQDAACPATTCAAAPMAMPTLCGRVAAKVCRAHGLRPGCRRCVTD